MSVFSEFFRKLITPGGFLYNRLKEFAIAAAIVGLGGYSQAFAISIGDMQVRSRLGQPLDAIVHVTAAPGEILQANCFRLDNPGTGALPPVTNVQLSLSASLSGGASLRLRGRDTLREPMSELILRVDCAGTPSMTRTFLVLLDPPTNDDLRADDTVAATRTAANTPANVAPVASNAVRPQSVADIVSESPRVQIRPTYVGPNEPIRPGSVYVVQRGDVLSMIASRVAGRGDYTVWPIAERILGDNPQAFEDGDPNLLEVGASLTIPSLEAGRLATNVPAVPTAIKATRSNPSTVQRAELSMPAPTDPSPEPARPELATRAALRPASVGDVPVPLSVMMLTQRLSGVSRERLKLRRSGQLQVLPSAVTEAPPEPQQPPQPLPPAAPTPAAAQPVIGRTELARSGGLVSGLMSWLLLLLGIVVGVIATVFGLRKSTQQRIENEVAARIKAQQYQQDLDENRRSRETIPANERIIVDEMPAPAPTPVPMPAPAPVVEEEVASLDDIAEQIRELAPVHLESMSEEVETASYDGADEDEDEFNFELFEEPNALDLELLARDYAQSVTDVEKLEIEEQGGAPMLAASELGLVEEGTEVMSTALDLELPEEKELPETGLTLDDDATVLSDAFIDHREPTVPVPEQPASSTMEIDAGLLAMTQVLDESCAVSTPSVAPAPETAAAGTESEEFYHLEASSVMPAGDLEFEADRNEDESKVLKFRHPHATRTGTDDSSGES